MRRRGAGDAALTLLDRALSLWRGRPLAEFTGVPLLDDAVGRMTELHLTVNEDWAELQIERARYVDVLHRLDDLAPFFPARERLIAARMTALARCGRDARGARAVRGRPHPAVGRPGHRPQPGAQAALHVDPDGQTGRKAPRYRRLSARILRSDKQAITRGVRMDLAYDDLINDRDRWLIVMLARGYTTTRIAREMHLSRYTVAERISKLLDQFACSNRSQLVAYSYAHQFLNVGVWPPGTPH